MEVDVVYRVSKDLCWQYINRFVRPETINLALFRACPDPSVTKKTIRNAAGRLSPGGIFCILSPPEVVSDVIRTVADCGLRYHTVYYDFSWAGAPPLPVVLAYKNEIFKPKIDGVIAIDGMEEMNSSLINLSNYGDIVLCIGDGVLHTLEQSKMLGRQIIAFGDDDTWISLALNQGVREIQL